jgi:hypothetical protein
MKSTMEIAKQNNFEGLIDNVYQTHCLLQQNAQKAINLNLTIRNWLIGCYSIVFEQNGEDRAKYGTRLLEEMAKSIKIKGIKGLDTQSLRSCRTFYNTYPQIRQTVFAELQKQLSIPIRGSVTPELQMANNQEITIRGSVTPELPEEYPIPSKILLSRLSFKKVLEEFIKRELGELMNE